MYVANKIVLAGVAAWGFTIISVDIINGITYKDPGAGSIISVDAVVLATEDSPLTRQGIA